MRNHIEADALHADIDATEGDANALPAVITDRDLWPEDRETKRDARLGDEPDTELAVILLAAGCTPDYVAPRANFPTIASVRAFARDEDVKQAIRERRREREQRVADRAMVNLEQLLARPLKDSKAHVMAIRTALAVGGMIGKAQPMETKQVSDLTVSELHDMIAMTKSEIDRRENGDAGQYRPTLAQAGRSN